MKAFAAMSGSCDLHETFLWSCLLLQLLPVSHVAKAKTIEPWILHDYAADSMLARGCFISSWDVCRAAHLSSGPELLPQP